MHDAAVWVTAPCPVPVHQCKPGVLSTPYATVSDKLALQQTFESHGMVVLPACISQAQCQRLVAMSEERIAAAEVALRRDHPEIVVGETGFTFAEIGSRGNHRFDLLFDASEERPVEIPSLGNRESVREH